MYYPGNGGSGLQIHFLTLQISRVGSSLQVLTEMSVKTYIKDAYAWMIMAISKGILHIHLGTKIKCKINKI